MDSETVSHKLDESDSVGVQTADSATTVLGDMVITPIPVWLVEREIATFYGFEPTTASTFAPATKCQLEYLNEGGANFVFRILPSGNTALPIILQGKLLRLTKDLSHVSSAENQLLALEASFQDLFPPGNLIQHELISVDQSVLSALNVNLRAMNRPSHRATDFLPDESISGLLVTDMTPSNNDTLVQLKAKWLTQSPNAPPDAKRCRTCAMRAQRASEQKRTATDAQGSCPLDLISSNVEDRKRAVDVITIDRRLRDYLLHSAQPLFQRLRACQMEFDQFGILKTSDTESIQNLCKAMTLRDCTLFLKRSGNDIEARLGDLDLKQPEKLIRWKKVESALIRDGWYANNETEAYWKKEKICLLSR